MEVSDKQAGQMQLGRKVRASSPNSEPEIDRYTVIYSHILCTVIYSYIILYTVIYIAVYYMQLYI